MAICVLKFFYMQLWNTSHKRKNVVPSCKRSVENFGLGYIDLYLIHWPVSYKVGLHKHIKKSNTNCT